jgi:hypothetical protein
MQKSTASESNKEGDQFHRLKFIAYCYSQTSPLEGTTFEEFVQFAKFKLCELRGYLMNDPVWDRYADEAILVEYYATQFERNKEMRDAFEAKITGQSTDVEDTISWMERQKAENQKEIERLKRAKEESSQGEDEFEFVPPKQSG